MSRWITAFEYPTRLEAELAKARLESADIPVMVTSHGGAEYGPGFQGAIPGGVELKVPNDRLSDARAVLDDES